MTPERAERLALLVKEDCTQEEAEQIANEMKFATTPLG